MTVAGMHNEFKIGLDKVDSLSYPNLLTEEIDIFLNVAQEKFIKQRAYGNNIRRQGLEETQKRLDDLKNITSNYETSIFITNTSNKPNGAFVNLPANYKFAIEEEAIIEYIDCNNATVTGRKDVVPTTHDRYNKTKKDPFNKPDNEEVLRLGFERVQGVESFELITGDGNSIITYFLRYIREWNEIQYGTQYDVPTVDIDSELSSHTHREIIAIAIKDALQDIESPRYPTSKNELNNIE